MTGTFNKSPIIFSFSLILEFSKFQISKTIKNNRNHQKAFWFRKNFQVGSIIISLTLLPVRPKKMVYFEPAVFWSKIIEIGLVSV